MTFSSTESKEVTINDVDIAGAVTTLASYKGSDLELSLYTKVG